MKKAPIAAIVLLVFATTGTAWAQAPWQLTEPQVRSFVMQWGCSNVSRLSEGQSGHWFGRCQKGGETVDVMVDQNGKVSRGAPSHITSASARADLMAHGCNNVSSLSRGPRGSWHGRCDKGGKTVDVMVDPEGNIASK